MPDAAPQPFLVRHRFWVLLALGVLTYVPFLGLHDLWYPDEPDIGEVCRAMFVRDDWIVPYRNGNPWIDYWPGLYWAGAASSHALGGMDEFSLRLPSALAGILLALWTCAFVSRRFSASAGLWSGVLLLTFAQFAYNATGYRPDVLFSLFAAGGVFLYASGCEERARWLPRVGGFALFGLAVLVKGPLGLLLPGFVLTLWHGSRREWSRLFAMAPLTLVAIAVALPWALACANATSAEWFWGEIYAQNFMRFGEGGRGHVKPWHYYLTRIWADLAPWSPLLPFALVWAWRSPLRRDRYGQLALWWFLATLVFLSYATTKRQLYLLPAYPAIALLVGTYLAEVYRGGENRPDPRPMQFLARAMSLLLWGIGISGVLAAIAIEAELMRGEFEVQVYEMIRAAQVPLLLSGIVAAALGAWTWRGLSTPERCLTRMAAATAALYMLVSGLLLPPANAQKGYRNEGAWIRAQIGDEERFGLLFPGLAHHKMGALGYYSRALVELLPDEDAIDAFLAEHPDSIVLVHEDAMRAILRDGHADWEDRVLRELVAGGYRYFAVGPGG